LSQKSWKTDRAVRHLSRAIGDYGPSASKGKSKEKWVHAGVKRATGEIRRRLFRECTTVKADADEARRTQSHAKGKEEGKLLMKVPFKASKSEKKNHGLRKTRAKGAKRSTERGGTQFSIRVFKVS